MRRPASDRHPGALDPLDQRREQPRLAVQGDPAWRLRRRLAGGRGNRRARPVIVEPAPALAPEVSGGDEFTPSPTAQSRVAASSSGLMPVWNTMRFREVRKLRNCSTNSSADISPR